MADVTVSINVSDISYRTWLRTSYISTSIISDSGDPMIENNELGPDQIDAFEDFMEESVLEVAKLFYNRQGNVSGVPFEYDGTTVSYRFKEGEPLLPQANVLKSSLSEDVKNAIFANVTLLWWKHKQLRDFVGLMAEKITTLKSNIRENIHLLHD